MFEVFFSGYKQNLQQLVIDFFGSLMGSTSIVKLFLTFCKSHRGFTRQSENSKRAHLRVPICTKNTTKFNEKTPRETQKERNGCGRGGKKSQWRGGPAEGGPGKSKPATTTTTTTTTTPNPEQVGPEGPAPCPKQGLGFGSLGVGTTTTTTTTTPENLAKTLKHQSRSTL